LLDLERLAAENKAAKRLLEHWSTLPEVFRIPKKERKEQLREHEREAGKGNLFLVLQNIIITIIFY
jgi:hypothetical protein